MILSSADSDRFFRLYWGLNAYVNRQLKVISESFTADTFRQIPIEQLIQVRDAFADHPELLERYLEEDPDQLASEDRGLVAGWRLRDGRGGISLSERHRCWLRFRVPDDAIEDLRAEKR